MTDRMKTTAVWLLRLLTGITFILSGWAKCVDPWGFVIKIQEYLTAWSMTGLPRDIILVGAVALSLFELITGAALATGSLRRSTPISGLALMAFMLPLTVYIYIANPVADCGCFGDFIKLSNGATLLKNIVLTAALVILLKWHKKAKSLLRPTMQWLVLTIAGLYGLTLAIIGWEIQPVVDFRPYPVGAQLIDEELCSEENTPSYIYTKNGQKEVFTLDNLPDSTWTFVSKQSENDNKHEGLAIFDGDEEVTEDILSPTDGDLLILVVNNPGIDYLTRARLSNEIYDAIQANDGTMIGLVAASGDALEQWIELVRPRFAIFSASDTSLKELARGDAALVAVRDGRILWKHSLSAINPTIAQSASPIDNVPIYNDNKAAIFMTLLALLGLGIVIIIDYSHRRVIKSKARTKTPNESDE